jgi:CRISPR-associated protein Csx10
MTRLEFSVTLTMTSDWHIGTGAGRYGDIDSLIQRDSHGLPYIPAKTLTGIWRDACEVVAHGLDNSTPGVWTDWVMYLFGNQPGLPGANPEITPMPATLSVRSAHLPQTLAQALNQNPRLESAITFIKPGVKINEHTGCAEEECLRFVEMARLGAKLTAPCQLDLTGLNAQQQQSACALLFASTKMVERIGGKRRRGSGKCQMTVDIEKLPEDLKNALVGQNEQKTVIEWITQHPEVPKPPTDPDLSEIASEVSPTSTALSNQWHCLSLQIQTKTPITIAERTLGNVVQTLDYIPGTHLLGVIAKRLQPYLGQELGNAIVNNAIIITNATIAVGEAAGSPVPHALFGKKSSGGLEKGGMVYNNFVEEHSGDQTQLKGERQGYINAQTSDHLPVLVKVKTSLETHNTVADQEQRPNSSVGGVYSYEAIQANLIFVAKLRLQDSLVETLKNHKGLKQHNGQWWKCLQGAAQIGQSKKDDYGLVDITVVPPKSPASKEPKNSNGFLTIWLLSDLLLRDERLRPTVDIRVLERELAAVLRNEALGALVLTLRESETLASIMARSHRLESWQVRWQLPRPSLVGFAAGSCFVFKVQAGKIDSQRLVELEMTGLGERRVEGFGQIACNPPLLLEKTSKLVPEEVKMAVPVHAQNQLAKKIRLNSPDFAYAHTIELAAWRSAIQQAALAWADKSENRYQVIGAQTGVIKPSQSQLGSLRLLVNQLTNDHDTNQNLIEGWFGQQNGNADQKDKWQKRQEKWGDGVNQPQTLLTHSNQVWQFLKIDADALSLTKADLDQELWAEAVQILVDACIRAHKRQSEIPKPEVA